MFDRKVRRFIAKAFRQCAEGGAGGGRSRNDVNFFEVVALNAASFEGKRGVRLVQFHTPFRFARVSARRHGDDGDDDDEDEDDGGATSPRWSFNTSNVRRFRIGAGGAPPNSPSVAGLAKHGVFVDGQEISASTFAALLEVAPTTEAWSLVRDPSPPEQQLKVWRVDADEEASFAAERRPETAGPMRQVFDRPFLIVVSGGGRGSALLSLATLLAQSHFAGSKTTAPVLFAEQVTSAMAEAHNLILIGPSALRDRVMAQTPATFPFRLDGDGSGKNVLAETFSLDGCVYGGDDDDDTGTGGLAAGAVFLAPWRARRLALVLVGTSEAALTDLFRGSYASNQALTRAMFTNMMPDFMVTDPAGFRARGLGGLRASGYYNWDWSVSEAASVLNSCV